MAKAWGPTSQPRPLDVPAVRGGYCANAAQKVRPRCGSRVSLFVLSGCGSSRAASHRAFVQRVNRICAGYSKQAKALHQPPQLTPAYLRKHSAYLRKHLKLKLSRKARAGLARYYKQVFALERDFLRDLEAVKPPKADRYSFSVLLAHLSHLSHHSTLTDDIVIARRSQALGLSTCFYDPELGCSPGDCLSLQKRPMRP
jgi:hypothetical protein